MQVYVMQVRIKLKVRLANIILISYAEVPTCIFIFAFSYRGTV